MFSKLYNEMAEYHTAEILDAARLGIDFLRQHAKTRDNRVFFCVDREGKVLADIVYHILFFTSCDSRHNAGFLFGSLF